MTSFPLLIFKPPARAPVTDSSDKKSRYLQPFCQHSPQMNARPWKWPALLIMWCMAPNPVRAASLIANGEFTASLTGWEKTGTVFDTGETAVLSDAVTRRTMIFQTAAVPDGVILLRLSFDLLTALSPVAGLGQTPDSVFVSAFFGTQPFGLDFESGQFDTAISILDADHLGLDNVAGSVTSGPSPKGALWTRFSMPLDVSPFATVAFEFIDGNGVTGDSTSAVDNVRLDAEFIPEPRTAAILAVWGLLCLRRRNHATP